MAEPRDLTDEQLLAEVSPWLEVGHSNRWFIRLVRPSEWVVRVWGFGFAVRDHRKIAPLWSERNRRRGHYFHVGPHCLAYLGRAS